MVGRRSPAAQLLVFGVAVAALAATGILWWTFAPSILRGADSGVLMAGEGAFQLVVVGVPLMVVQRRRRRSDAAAEEA